MEIETTTVDVYGENCQVTLTKEGKTWHAHGLFKGKPFGTKPHAGAGSRDKAIERWKYIVSLSHNN